MDTTTSLDRIHDCHINLSDSKKWFNSDLDASYEKIVDELDNAGIKKAVLIALPGACSNETFGLDKINRERFWCFGNLDFTDLKYSIDQIINLELDGVKVHPRFQNIGIDTLLEMDFINILEEKNLPLMICGWQQSNSVSIKSLDILYVDELAKKHPKLPIIISHLGGYRFWDAYTVTRSNPLVFMDCSYFLHAFKGTSLEADFFKMLTTIDQKILYGSDFPEMSIKKYLKYFKSHAKHLEKEKLSNIFYLNIEKLMNRRMFE